MSKLNVQELRLARAIAYCRRKLRLTYKHQRWQLFFSGTFSSDKDYFSVAARRLGKRMMPLIERKFDCAGEMEIQSERDGLRDLLLVLAQRIYQRRHSTDALAFLLSAAKNKDLPIVTRKQAVSMLVCSKAPLPLEDIRELYDERHLQSILSALAFCEDDGRHSFASEVLKRPPSGFDRRHAVCAMYPDRLTAEDSALLVKLYNQSKSAELRLAVIRALDDSLLSGLDVFFASAYRNERTLSGKLTALTSLYRRTPEVAVALLEDFAACKELADKGIVRDTTQLRVLIDWLSKLNGQQAYLGFVYAYAHMEKPPEPDNRIFRLPRRKARV